MLKLIFWVAIFLIAIPLCMIFPALMVGFVFMALAGLTIKILG